MKEINNGFTFRDSFIYRFVHIDMKEADELRDQSEHPSIIETINYTIAHDNKNQVHHNMYFTWTLTDAIKLATN